MEEDCDNDCNTETQTDDSHPVHLIRRPNVLSVNHRSLALSKLCEVLLSRREIITDKCRKNVSENAAKLECIIYHKSASSYDVYNKLMAEEICKLDGKLATAIKNRKQMNQMVSL